MIKRISLLTRRPELTHDEFVKHWYEVHGPLARSVPGLRRYVQSHISEEMERDDIETTALEVDGIAELWYDDKAAMLKAHQSAEAQALFADGALFIGAIKSFVVEEREIVSDL